MDNFTWDNKNQRFIPPDHLICRCIINPTYKIRVEISAIFVANMLINEYEEECKESLIWIN